MSSSPHAHASKRSANSPAAWRDDLVGLADRGACGAASACCELNFALAKIVGRIIGHAYVLIADGIESGLDVGGSFVIWGGLTSRRDRRMKRIPYGHGKAEPIAAMLLRWSRRCR